MKRAWFLLLPVLLLWTSIADAYFPSFSPQEMLEKAEYIVVGTVVEVRRDGKGEVIVQPDIFYRGELNGIRLAIPLPPEDNLSISSKDLRTGSSIMLLLQVNETGVLAPVAGLNWAALLEDEQVNALYMGAAVHEWDEEMYIDHYNNFLTVTPGAKVIRKQGEEQAAAVDNNNSKNFSGLMLLAGITLITVFVTVRLRKPAKKL